MLTLEPLQNPVPVPRPQDYAVKGAGMIYTTDPEGQVTTLRGIGTEFKKQLHPRAQIVLPNKEQVDVIG